MKTLVASLLGIVLAVPLHAQDSPKNDLGYSSHNYKHGNKAKIAQTKEKESSKWLSIQSPGLESHRQAIFSTSNYKAMNHPVHPNTDRLVFTQKHGRPTITNPSLAPNNYKRQGKIQQDQPEEVAKRKGQTSVDSQSVGEN
ncbi:MAG: hypothetical protein U0Y10_17980 [Spirosomataceae bacterium]